MSSTRIVIYFKDSKLVIFNLYFDFLCYEYLYRQRSFQFAQLTSYLTIQNRNA
jgi:hypothetical protein